MGFKQTRLYSILTYTCPRCHRGPFFVTSSNYRKGFTRIRPACSHCGEDFLREPGFYFGAAYVSYGLTVGLWIAVFVALSVFDALGWIDFSFYDDGMFFLLIGFLVLLVLLPPLYRLSRIIWINMFVGYREDAVEYNQHQLRRETTEQRSASERQSRH